jgi:phage-related protein
MAAYSYAGLLVRVTADTKPLTAGVHAAATKSGDEAGKTLGRSISGRLGKAAGSVGRGLATALGTGTIAATAFGVESFKAAAKVQTMDAALQALARANHASYPQMQSTVEALRKQGIEAGAAQSLVAAFTKGHLDLTKATKLGTIAQNASTITGRSSADTLLLLNRGIQTQNVRLLRSAGVAVDVKKAQADYAAQLGITVKQLTSQQKSQAVLNAVMANGQKVSGAYAAAMKTPGGVLKQLPVIIDEVKVAVGEGLVKALGPSIVGIGHLATSFLGAIEPGGKLAPIFDAIGKAAAGMLSPLTGVIDLTARWLDNMKPGQIDAMTTSVAKFAPEIAAVATGLSAFAGKNLLGELPIVGKLIGGLGGPIGIVVSSLATLALTSPQARAALGQLATMVGGALAPVMAAIGPAVGQLGQALAVVLTAGLRAVLPLVPALTVVLIAALHVVLPLVPVITTLANILAAMAPVLVPLILAWKTLTLVTGLYTAAIEANIVANITSRAETAALVAMYAAQKVALVASTVATYAVRAATIAWTAAQWLLNAALDANPIGIVIVALAALGTALYLAWTRSATFRDIVIGAWRAVRAAVSAVTSFLTANIGTFARVALAVMTSGGSEIVRVVIGHWSSIRNFVSGVISFLARNIGTFARVALAVMTGGGSELVRVVVGHWSQIRGAITGAMSAAGRAVSSGFSGMIGAASSLLGQLGGVVSRAWSNLVSGAWRAGADLIAGLRNGMLAGVSNVGSWIGDITGRIIGAVKGFFGIGSPSTVFISIGANLLSSLMRGMTPASVNSLVTKVFGTFPQALASLIRRGFVAITQLPKKALNAVRGLLGGALSGVKGVFTKLLGGIGFASGGVLREPVTGIGRSGQVYHFAERGPELVSPLRGPAPGTAGLGAAAGAVINVYPSAGMDERALAAMVSRELAWAGAGGAR